MSTLAMTGYDMLDSDRDVPSGRHAFIEDAVLTPIFHALTRGRPRQPRPEPATAPPVAPPDPMAAFRRDPLTAPIPRHALLSAPSQPSQPSHQRPAADPIRSAPGRRRLRRGRHHRHLELV